MSDSKLQSRKRKKNYYRTCAKKSCKRVLEPGMKGFLLTCNQKEKFCVREAYNILNEYADKLYDGNGQNRTASGSLLTEDKVSHDDESFEEELNSLKELAKSPQRFQQVNTKTKNVLFIETQVDDPCHLVYSILKDIKETQKQKCRYLFRFLPVSITCKGHLESIEKAVEKLLTDFTHQNDTQKDASPVPYTVIVKIRNNNSVKRDDIIRIVLNLVKGKEIPWTPTLKNSELAICVEVVQTVCCLSILKDYFALKKYNLIEVAKSTLDKLQDAHEESALEKISE